jgi:hypothetical protein
MLCAFLCRVYSDLRHTSGIDLAPFNLFFLVLSARVPIALNRPGLFAYFAEAGDLPLACVATRGCPSCLLRTCRNEISFQRSVFLFGGKREPRLPGSDQGTELPTAAPIIAPTPPTRSGAAMRADVCWSRLPLAPRAAPMPNPMRAPIRACRRFLGCHAPLGLAVRGYPIWGGMGVMGLRWASSEGVWPASECAMSSLCVAGLPSTKTLFVVRRSFAVCISPVCAKAQGSTLCVNRTEASRKRTIRCLMGAD